jgi:hypothetical protein
MIISGKQITELAHHAIGQKASTLKFGNEIFGGHAIIRA